tara:strand:- start:290 stop:1309 length:1020 start_codon:yes stop_codon:yes gene_type:complete
MNFPKTYTFVVVNEAKCSHEGCRRDGALVDDKTYERIVSVTKSFKKITLYSNSESTLFSVSPDDTAAQMVFGLLADKGITPAFQYHLESKDKYRHFTVHTGWKPSRLQMSETKYFQIIAPSRITPISRDLNVIGQLLGIDPDHLAHISASKEQWKRPQELAELRERLFVVSDRFRRQVEEAGLIGLKLNDITWYYQAPGHGWNEVDPIDDPRGRKWMGSSVRMPPCLTPRRYTEGPLVGKIVKERKPKHHHCFDSEGLAPAVLRFSRVGVEKLGEFDVAVTRECTHQTKEYMGPNEPSVFCDADYWLPDVIVSRRFKDWFAKSGLHGSRHVDFRIVELA